MKKLVMSLGLLCSIALTLKAQEAKPAAVVANPNASEFKFDQEEYDFGKIKQGESVTYEFKFKNVGKEPLIISEAHGSCGCTQPIFPKEPIMKGKDGVIKVTFNSAGKMGVQDKTVTITSNSKTPSRILHIKGNVEAPAVAVPAPAQGM
ncbi:MAG: DUF1573 domain-containing protein [Bacteroidia bacterium]|nr:DUF1573 domain-containing protein [Bacteroidia bacterium]